MFSKSKLLIREARSANEMQLFELIESCSHLITNNDREGYYRNFYSFLLKCLEKQEIIDGN